MWTLDWFGAKLEVDNLDNAEITKLKRNANPLEKAAVLTKFVAKGTFIIWPIIILIILKTLKIKKSVMESMQNRSS